MSVSRRTFLDTAVVSVAAVAAGDLFACVSSPAAQVDGHLKSRPRTPGKSATAGESALGLRATRDAFLYVPPSYVATKAAPLLVVLYGATGEARRWLNVFKETADQTGCVVLSPSSSDYTWDAIRGDFGADVTFIDRALSATFDRCLIDPRHLAIVGFSDGATYALTMGLANGDLFTHIIALSPGFVVEVPPHGKPGIFVAHGTSDEILPIDRTSRRIVPALKQRGYDVTYHEFAGGHGVRSEILGDAVRWMLGS